ncbi:MAG TPA: DUF3592 domain-containing protein [Longimicrobium sp.]|nr:DUF3592 domain-containing protein [Longimicrobium sp.]
MRPQLIAPSLLVLSLGLYWTWTYLSLLLRAQGSGGWPSTSGVVPGRYASDADGTMDMRSYAAGVRYEYTVGEVSYRSTVVSLRHAFPFWSIGGVMDFQKPYRDGASVKVFYDPDHPRALGAGARRRHTELRGRRHRTRSPVRRTRSAGRRAGGYGTVVPVGVVPGSLAPVPITEDSRASESAGADAVGLSPEQAVAASVATMIAARRSVFMMSPERGE